MDDPLNTAREAAVSQPAAGRTRVTLQYPVTVLGMPYTHLDLRRLNVRDVLHAEKRGGPDAEKEVSQFASLAGVPPDVIESLDMADYLKLQETLKGFLSSPPAT